jgi:hypothetical protein
MTVPDCDMAKDQTLSSFKSNDDARGVEHFLLVWKAGRSRACDQLNISLVC